jgi:hypothetical protein
MAGSATSGVFGYSKGSSLGTQGLIPGGLTLQSGSVLNLGNSYGNTSNSLGTMTTSALSITSATINYQIGSTTNSFIAVTGALTINSGSIELYQEGTTTAYTQTGNAVYDLIGYNTETGSVNELSVADPTAGYSYTFVNDTTDDMIQLDVQQVPEPNTWMLLGGGAALLALWQRRRQAAVQA